MYVAVSPFDRQHLRPTEDVVALAILGQVGVLDGADAHGLGDPRAGGLVEFGAAWFFVVAGVDDLAGLDDRFIEERFKPDRVARARLVRLLILVQDRSETDVPEFDVVHSPSGAPFRTAV